MTSFTLAFDLFNLLGWKWYSGKLTQSLHIHLWCQNLPLANHGLKVLEVPHEEARRCSVDEDGLLVERIAESVRQSHRYSYHLAGSDIDMRPSWHMKSDASFLERRVRFARIIAGHPRSLRTRPTVTYIESFIVHLMKMKDWAITLWRDQTLYHW